MNGEVGVTPQCLQLERKSCVDVHASGTGMKDTKANHYHNHIKSNLINCLCYIMNDCFILIFVLLHLSFLFICRTLITRKLTYHF